MSDDFSYEEKERVQDLEKAILQHERDLYEREKRFNKEQIIAELKAEIDQLKQQNEELMLQLSKYEIEKHKPAYCTLAGTECEYLGNVDELKQQLAEKDTRIAELEDKDWYEACIKQLEEQNNRLIDTLKEKDEEIKSLIADYEKRISQEQELMSNMEHQLTEKQNTIDEINKEFVQAVHDWKVLCAEKDKEIEKLRKGEYQKCCQHCEAFQHLVEVSKQDANDLAIQELEKVHAMLVSKAREVVGTGVVAVRLYTINEVINQQIKELKGEKDVED